MEIMKEITRFDHEVWGTLEVVTVEEKPMFIATEVAKVLGYVKPNNAIHTHCKSMILLNTPLQGIEIPPRGLNIIPEKDVYRLVMRSKLPQAEKFQDWVMDTVLPSIRKNGAYISGQEDMDDTEIMARGLLASQNIIDAKNKLLGEQSTLIQSKNTPVSLSKMYGKRHKVVQAANLYLEDMGYIEKYFKKGVKLGWVLTDKGAELGFGSQVSDSSIFWTPDIVQVLPSTKELMEFANNDELFDYRGK